MVALFFWNVITNKLALCGHRVGVEPLYLWTNDVVEMLVSDLQVFYVHLIFHKAIIP